MKRGAIIFLALLSLNHSLYCQERDTLSLLFLGDIMQHRTQLRNALEYGSDSLLSESYDYSSYFKYIKEYIDSAHFTIANMEFTCGVTPYTGYPSFSAPSSLAAQAKASGIDLFLCANNHICDKGRRGIESTINNYNEIGASYTGIYRNEEEERVHNPFFVELKGIKIAFINFTYGTNGIPIPSPYIVNLQDSLHLKEVILRAKERAADIIIAIPHWGQEYNLHPSSTQKKWEAFLHREGINTIIGSHPHVVQDISIVRKENTIESVTVYSLGNLISNMSKTNTQAGYIFTIKIVRDDNGKAVITDAYPKWIWCARGGRFEKGYTILPIEKFINRKEDFLSEYEYEKMKTTYEQLKQIYTH